MFFVIFSFTVFVHLVLTSCSLCISSVSEPNEPNNSGSSILMITHNEWWCWFVIVFVLVFFDSSPCSSYPSLCPSAFSSVQQKQWEMRSTPSPPSPIAMPSKITRQSNALSSESSEMELSVNHSNRRDSYLDWSAKQNKALKIISLTEAIGTQVSLISLMFLSFSMPPLVNSRDSDHHSTASLVPRFQWMTEKFHHHYMNEVRR